MKKSLQLLAMVLIIMLTKSSVYAGEVEVISGDVNDAVGSELAEEDNDSIIEENEDVLLEVPDEAEIAEEIEVPEASLEVDNAAPTVFDAVITDYATDSAEDEEILLPTDESLIVLENVEQDVESTRQLTVSAEISTTTTQETTLTKASGEGSAQNDEMTTPSGENNQALGLIKDGWDESGTHFYEEGVLKKGFVDIDGKTFFFDKNGLFQMITGLVKDSKGNWKYVKDGVVDYKATGLVQCVQPGHSSEGKYFYVEDGIFIKNATGMVKGVQPDSEVKGNWYYVQGGQYKGKGTGLVENIQGNHVNRGDFYYVENGLFAKNSSGLVKGIQPKSEVKGNWYYVQKGHFKENGTCLVENIHAGHKNKGIFYYVDDGKYDKTYTGPARSDTSIQIFHVENGRWADSTTGNMYNEYGNYKVKNGVVYDSKVVVDGRTLRVTSTGVPQGWANQGKKRYYYDASGKPVTGRHMINDRWYFFDKKGVLSSRVGIDVSRFNGEINWHAVKNDGIDFVFIRVGGRGWGSGEIYEDANVLANLRGANEAGIPCGVYFFTQAITIDEVMAEANFTLDKIKGFKIDMPVVIDSEPSDAQSRHRTISRQLRTDIIKTFCDHVSDNGYTAMYYAGGWWSRDCLNVEQLDDKYDHWVPHYYKECTYEGPYVCWQYSDCGRVAGIYGDVDMNIWYDTEF